MPIDLGLLFVLCITAFIVILYAWDYKRRKLTSARVNSQQIQNQTYATVQDTSKKAQTILSELEGEEVKLVTDTKFRMGKLEEQYAEDLKKLIEHSQKLLSEVVNKTQQDFSQYLDNLRRIAEESSADVSQAQRHQVQTLNNLGTQVEQHKFQSEEIVKQHINQLFDQFEQNLTEFLTQAEQRSVYNIELELSSTRELIETYKKQQLTLIDENITAVLERTLGLVLAKKLSLKDHLDLVYQSLEKAKLENFII